MMKKTIALTAAVAIHFLLWTTDGLAEKLVFSTSEWTPYIILEQGKSLGGIHVEMLLELCGRVGIEPEIRNLPWARAMKYMREGKVDALFSPKKTEERMGFISFCSEPMGIEKLVIMSRKENEVKAASLDDLKGEEICVVRDYSYGPKFDGYKDLDRIICNDDNEMLRILAKGRIGLGIGEEGNMLFLAKELGLKDRFKTVYVVSEDPDYIGFSKKALGEEKADSLADRFGKVLRQMKEEGLVEKIRGKYF